MGGNQSSRYLDLMPKAPKAATEGIRMRDDLVMIGINHSEFNVESRIGAHEG